MAKQIEIDDDSRIIVVFPGETINDNKRPIGISIVEVPEKAKVSLERSELNWGGDKGYTYFVVQDPPVNVTRKKRKPFGPATFTTDNFLGGSNNPSFSPDGTFSPSNLPDLIEEVQNWGWEIDPQIFTLLSIQGRALAVIGKKINQQKRIK